MVTHKSTDEGPDLLLHWQDQLDSRSFLRDGVGSLVVHVLVVALAVWLASIPTTPLQLPVITADLRKAVRIVAPRPQQLTQRAPNTAEVAKEVNVEGLLSRQPATQHIPTPPRTFKAPAPPVAAAPPPKQPQLLPEPPKVDALLNPPANVPQFGTPQAPPPTRVSPEPPKLALETPGQSGVGSQPVRGLTRIAPPKTSVEDAIHSVARGAGQGGGLMVGDEDQLPSIADPLHRSASPASVQSSLQLLSDPQGVDFKPYLIRILATVRRNWLAIIPESARMGRRGKVLLQFIVDRSGAVPKLVIAMPSGAEALDRAAVAGISASVPFPPLPSEFKGSEVRLQFAFSYNMK